jgi:hypothetical protein
MWYQTTGSIHVVSYSEAVMMLEDPVTVSTSRAAMRIAARDVMLAIGAQCCRSEPAMVTAEKFFFARGQRVAFAGMLEDPSLELVRVFTLMSFYMLGACRRNTAFMYLGVAVQAAVAVGLHNEEAYSTAPEAEREKRLGRLRSHHHVFRLTSTQAENMDESLRLGRNGKCYSREDICSTTATLAG